jgi:gamma-glutamylcyclotransferase (GGCT)/AIG2-like uncharacterized protein YtfP
MPTKNLFVYGTLRSGFHNPAYEYVSKYFTFLGEAKVKGKLYDLGEYPAAIETDENFFIIGELYAIKEPAEFSWAIGQLDDYEGVHLEEGETPLYKRIYSTIYFQGKEDLAWVYWYNKPIQDGFFIESGDMLSYLQQKK